jgi:hypothetical protein
MTKGKNNRKNALRPCWDLHTSDNHKNQDGRTENCQMAKLDSRKSSEPFFGDDRKKLVAKLRKPKSIASSLYPSIVNGRLGQGQDLSEQNHVIQQVKDALSSCGYMNSDPECDTAAMLTLSVILSTSYAANLRLDSKFKCISYTERPLSWVHATLCHGGRSEIHSMGNDYKNVSISGKREYHCVDQRCINADDNNKKIKNTDNDSSGGKNSNDVNNNSNMSNDSDRVKDVVNANSLSVLRDHDLRFMLSTSEPISIDNSAYKLFYPSSDSSPPISFINGQPVKADHISKETFAKISYCRFVQERINMTCQNAQSTVLFKAQITRGSIHEAQKLTTRSEFIDLSLHADCSALVDWFHSGRHDHAVIHQWAAEVARHGLSVSGSLKLIKDMNQN